MKAAIYVRMSTDEQVDSPEVQIREAKRFITAKGWQLGPIYRDEGMSRAEFVKRRDLLRMVDDAKRGELFEVVVARDDDRIGGDMYRTGIVLMSLLDAGAAVWFYQSGDEAKLDDPVSRFMQAAKGFASELERVKTSERTREVLVDKFRQRKVPGGSCFGYRNVRVGTGAGSYVTHEINEEQAEIVREIFWRFADGEGLRSICKDLNRRGIASSANGERGTGSWSPSALGAMLRRERYIGMLVYGKTRKAYKGGTKVRLEVPREEWEIDDAPELRIVSDDLWARVEARIKQNERLGNHKGGRKGPPAKHLLSGLGRCSECGGPIGVHRRKNNTTTVKAYCCAHHRERGTCGNSLRRPIEDVDAAVLAVLADRCLRENTIIEILREVRERLKQHGKRGESRQPELRKQVANLQSELTKLGAALLASDEAPATIVAMIAEREAQVRELKAQIAITEAAPGVLDLEVRRIEQEARKRLDDVRTLMAGHPGEARKALEAILHGPLTFTPVEVDGGKRYRVEGSVLVGRLLTADRSVGVPSGIRTRVTSVKG